MISSASGMVRLLRSIFLGAVLDDFIAIISHSPSRRLGAALWDSPGGLLWLTVLRNGIEGRAEDPWVFVPLQTIPE